MKITVSVPTVRPDSLGHTVAAVRRQTWQDWQLVVVGQGDQEAALREATTRAAGGDPRVRYHHIHERGLSRARNAAVQLATGDVLAFTDDDCEPAADWLSVIGDALLRDPEVGLVAGAVLPPGGSRGGWLTTCPTNEPREVRYDPRGAGGSRPAGWDWIGANFAVRREVVDAVGAFDVHLGAGAGFPSGEDTDYKFRLERLGVVMLTTPRAVVHHTYGERSGLRAGFAHSRNYARGNAAMAAKLTLQGDSRGPAWWRESVWGTAETRKRDVLPHRVPVALLRRWHFVRAYRDVLRNYRAEPGGLLQQTAARPDEATVAVRAGRS